MRPSWRVVGILRAMRMRKMWFQPRLTLLSKIIGAVSLIMFVVLGVLTSVFIHLLKNDYMEALKLRSEALSEAIFNNIEVIKKYNPDYLQNIPGLLEKLSVRCAQLYEANKTKQVAHFAVVNADGLIAAHNDAAQLRRPVSDALRAGMQQRRTLTMLDDTVYHTLIPIIADQNVFFGAIDIGVPQQVIQTKINHVLLSAAQVFGVCVALSIVLLALLMHAVVLRRVRVLTRASQELAHGDYTRAIPITALDELGVLASAFHEMQVNVSEVVRNVKMAAQDMAQRSREMNAVAEQMSQGASQQAAATEEVSASMQEMAANIRQTADNTKQAEQIALKSAEDAQAGKQAVTQIIQAMTVIAERISVIQEIASQTNMLSLNATIEAAKAQDYGKGFTVVASSVRDLASQTRRSADDIRALVTSCVTLSAQAGEVLERLVPNSQHTSELVQEISASSQEQSHGVTQVNQAVQQLDVVTQRNAATAEELASTAETLTTQAAALQETMAFFTVKELAPVKPPDNEDVLRRLQGIDKDQLVALLTSALNNKPVAAPAAEPQAHAADHAQPEGGRDALDGEFERY